MSKSKRKNADNLVYTYVSEEEDNGVNSTPSLEWEAPSLDNAMEEISVNVRDLSYAIQSRKHEISVLLQNITFDAAPGEVVAVMGASGAGKSTLLDIIAGRKTEGFISGEVHFNGKHVYSSTQRNSVYVEQIDLHFPNFTVRETLEFSARLQLSAMFNAKRRLDRVNEVIGMLDLHSCAESLVGDAIRRGISGGQMKRLSIGTKLLGVPSLLFLDEPTTGLDSAAALELGLILRNLATAKQHTIIATIHQPPPEVFSLFDKVLLLAKGQEIFFGPVSQCHLYFSSPSLGFTMKKDENPAEFIMRAAAGGEISSGRPDRVILSPDVMAAIFKRSSFYSSLGSRDGNVEQSLLDSPDLDEFRLAQVELGGARHSSQRSMSSLSNGSDQRCCSLWIYVSTIWENILEMFLGTSRCKVGFQMQLQTVMRRSWIGLFRDKELLSATLLKNLFVGLLSAAIFWGAGRVGPKSSLIDPITGDISSSASNLMSLQYFAILYATTGHLQAVGAIFQSKYMFQKERSAGLYSTMVYWIVETTVHLPLLVVAYTVYINIAYWAMGLTADVVKYWYFYFFILVATMIGYTTAQFFSALLPTPKLVFSVWPIFFITFANFSGFAVRINNVVIGLRWLCTVSFVRWIFQGSVTNAFYGFDEEEDLLALYGFDKQGRNECLYWVLLTYVLFSVATLWALLPPQSTLKVLSTGQMRENLAPGKAKSESSEGTNIPPIAELGSLVQRFGNGGGYYLHEEEESVKVPLLKSDHNWTVGGKLADEKEVLSELLETAGTSEKGSGVYFKDLHYKIVSGEMHILRGVGGFVDPGEILCIMGASGAGKTTLLDILAGRKSTKYGRTEGLLHFTDPTVSAAYVMQDNVHVSCLTVRESLEFASRLRIPTQTGIDSVALRRRRVDCLLAVMGLTAVQHARVGGEGSRGISGGEMKRLSIAVEIVNLPSLVCCDEPTSGLDSVTASSVMRAVKNLALLNRTVITTIHQPSPEIFELFDRLLILSEGRTVYFGPASKAADHFSMMSSMPSIYSDARNPADFIMSVVSNTDLNELVRVCIDSNMWDEFLSREGEIRGEKGVESRSTQKYARALGTQCLVLTERHLLKNLKNRRLWLTSIGRNAFIGAFYGVLWWQLGPNRLYERFSVLFFSLIFIMLGNQQAIPGTFEDRLIFYRERSACAYGTFAHWISTTLSNLPLLVVDSLVFSVLLYYMTGLNQSSGDKFGYFLLVLNLSNLVALSVCQMLGSACRTQQVTIAIFPVLLFFFIAFGGFIVRVPTLPLYLRSWAPQVSFVRWALQGLVINEFKGNDDLFPIPPGIPISPDDVYNELLDTYGFGGTGKWAAVPILLASFAVFKMIDFFLLKFINFERR